MVRSCHLDTCPVGIATQRPELRAKFAGDAGAGRGVPAARRRGGAAAARRARAAHASTRRSAASTCCARAAMRRAARPRRRCSRAPRAGGLRAASRSSSRRGGELGERLAAEAAPALEEARIVELAYPIANRDRAVGARLGGEIGRALRRRAAARPRPRALRGLAGQSFGAFLAAASSSSSTGEANDYVGKAMGGGRIVVRPPEDDAGDPVPARQHRALRRDGRRALLRRPRRRALRGAQLGRDRGRRGRRRPRVRVHDGRHGRRARRASAATSAPG